MINPLLVLTCAACFAPAEGPPANPLYEPFLADPVAKPSSPTSITLAYFDVDLDQETSTSIYLAVAKSSAFANKAVIEDVFGNFLVSSSASRYAPFNLDRRRYPAVIWRSKSGALWREDQVVQILNEKVNLAAQESVTSRGLGFGFISRTDKSFDRLKAILSQNLKAEKISDGCLVYRTEPLGSHGVVTGFAIRDQDGVLDLYDSETIECVGQFLARSMGLKVGHDQILALTGFDQQIDKGKAPPLSSLPDEAGGRAAGSLQSARKGSGYVSVEARPDSDYLRSIADGGCELASVVTKSANSPATRLAESGCPTAPSAAAVAYPCLVHGMGSGENESSVDRINELGEICRKNVVSNFVAEDFCKY